MWGLLACSAGSTAAGYEATELYCGVGSSTGAPCNLPHLLGCCIFGVWEEGDWEKALLTTLPFAINNPASGPTSGSLHLNQLNQPSLAVPCVYFAHTPKKGPPLQAGQCRRVFPVVTRTKEHDTHSVGRGLPQRLFLLKCKCARYLPLGTLGLCKEKGWMAGSGSLLELP